MIKVFTPHYGDTYFFVDLANGDIKQRTCRQQRKDYVLFETRNCFACLEHARESACQLTRTLKSTECCLSDEISFEDISF